MLGVERDIVSNHVATGEVKIVYWPMLDLGPNSTNAAAAAFCAGEQDPAHFWTFHHTLFEDQRRVYLARRDYFVETAAALGLDTDQFETCYDGDDVRATLEQLDATRREAGIRQRPTFDVGGRILLGSHTYETFAETIADSMP